MSKFKTFLFSVLFLVMVFGAGWGLIILAKWIILHFLSLQSDVLKIIIPTTASILLGFVSIVLSKYFEKKKDIEFKLREEKVKVYDFFMTTWFEVLNKPADIDGDEFVVRMRELSRQMIIWSSDSVLKKYTNWRLMSAEYVEGSITPQEMISVIGGIMLEFRKDLGHKNKGVSNKDVLGTFINDIDTFIESSKRK